MFSYNKREAKVKLNGKFLVHPSPCLLMWPEAHKGLAGRALDQESANMLSSHSTGESPINCLTLISYGKMSESNYTTGKV